MYIQCSLLLDIPCGNVCTDEYNPVCADNGKTYGNSCAALDANVEVLCQVDQRVWIRFYSLNSYSFFKNFCSKRLRHWNV